MWFVLLAIALAIVVVGGLYFRSRLLIALEVFAVPGKHRRLVGIAIVWLLYGFPVLVFLFVVASKFGIRFGQLPGDLVWKPTKNSTVYLPIATSIVLSILLTLLLSFFNRR